MLVSIVTKQSLLKMSAFPSTSKLEETNFPLPQKGKKNLLSKYAIPISHFEYDYIEKCKDSKELEKILLILRSGEEGYFPDLENTTEKHLGIIKPKSKLLRTTMPVLKKTDLKKNNLETIFTDLNNWLSEVSKDEKELQKMKTSKSENDTNIRSSKELNRTIQNKEGTTGKRISSTDFVAWDKYDPDTEIQKMELEEEQQKSECSNKGNVKNRNINNIVDIQKFNTNAEKKFASNQEKEKGNEFYKNGDFEEALICFTNSIRLKANIDNLNNRAITYIKLTKYENAIADCQKVINLDKNNVKAHWRLAESLEKTKKYDEALKHMEFVIQQDPNNHIAQKFAEKIMNNCKNILENTHMQIIDSESFL